MNLLAQVWLPLPTPHPVRRCIFLFVWLLAFRFAHADELLDVSGEWRFAVDPGKRGESLNWMKPDPAWSGERPHPSGNWDVVKLPHDFLSDPRYGFTGQAWYRCSFRAPGTSTDPVAILRFEQVSQRCQIWLNGQWVGRHEGGYTPFSFDVSAQIRRGQENFLVVAVDNEIRLRALPGARTGSGPESQVFPWLNYGGILGAVRLEIKSPVYIESQRIETNRGDPAGDATIVVRVRTCNRTEKPEVVRVHASTEGLWSDQKTITVPPRATEVVELQGILPASLVKNWDLEKQPLYEIKTVLTSDDGQDTRKESFAVRTVAVREGKLLLNGQPVRVAGANRARGLPRWGGRDPDAVIVEDMALLKAAGLRFARLQHTPPHVSLLDWADHNGMLLILEVGVWGYPAADLASTELRDHFKAEMRELVELAANHPCVVGWSLGNEYESWTPEGIAWTRDMAEFVRSLDATRPLTFAAIGTALRRLAQTSDSGSHAFDLVDFISANVYMPPPEAAGLLDRVHDRWPQKPVFISEFGQRVDTGKSEDDRIAYFDAMLGIVRARPWICGMSVWSFNDYPSRYPGTNPDGYRRWGLVDEFRRPRPLYEILKQRVVHGLDGPGDTR